MALVGDLLVDFFILEVKALNNVQEYPDELRVLEILDDGLG